MVTTALFTQDEQAVRVQVLKLARRVQLLLGIVRLLFVPVRLFDARVQVNRGLTGNGCRLSATAVAGVGEVIGRSDCLIVSRLSRT